MACLEGSGATKLRCLWFQGREVWVQGRHLDPDGIGLQGGFSGHLLL
jgi:hypothetical protein